VLDVRVEVGAKALKILFKKLEVNSRKKKVELNCNWQSSHVTKRLLLSLTTFLKLQELICILRRKH